MDKFLDLLLSEDNLETNTLAAFVTAFCYVCSHADFDDWTSQLKNGSKEYNDLIGLVSSLDLEIVADPYQVLQKYEEWACQLMIEFDNEDFTEDIVIYVNRDVDDADVIPLITKFFGLTGFTNARAYRLEPNDESWLTITEKGKKNEYLIELPCWTLNI